MPRIVWLPLCAALLAPAVAQAATLRAYRALPGSTVRLSDLFDGMAAPDRVLGAAPAPGARILVQAPQLAAIARDYGVDWRPMTGAEQTILERQSTPYSLESLRALLRPELARAGAPADSTIVLPDFAPPALPVGVAAHAAIADFSYDPASSRFTALLTLTVADSPPVAARLAGEVVQLVDAAVLTHPLHAGAVIEAEDVRAAHLPATDLRGETALGVQAVLGLAVRRDFPAGQALAMGDLTHPVLVARNASVRMALDAGPIALAAEGLALEEGAMGAHIRVQNPNSHAVMVAEVTGAGAVRIMPNHAPLVAAAP